MVDCLLCAFAEVTKEKKGWYQIVKIRCTKTGKEIVDPNRKSCRHYIAKSTPKLAQHFINHSESSESE